MKMQFEWWSEITHFSLCGLDECEICNRFLETRVHTPWENERRECNMCGVDVTKYFDEYNAVADQRRVGVMSKAKMLARIIDKSVETGKVFNIIREYLFMKCGDKVICVHKSLEDTDYFQWIITEQGFKQHMSIGDILNSKHKLVICMKDSVFPIYRLQPDRELIETGVRMVEAVPGAGKTSSIKAEIKSNQLLDQVVLVATNEQKKDYENMFDHDILQVRTVDSYINEMNKIMHTQGYFIKPVAKVLIDEVFMIHAAQVIYLKSILPDCTIFKCFGDRGQIPIQSRVKYQYQLSRLEDDLICEKMLMNKSHRITQVSKRILSKVYPGISTTNECSQYYKTEIVNINNWYVRLSKIKKCDQVIVFTQSEKEMVQKHFGKVLTVNESQGMTFNHVVLIRLHYYEVPLYTNVNYLTVAFSRNKGHFNYLTVREDEIYKMIKSNGCLEHNEWNTKSIGIIKAPEHVMSYCEDEESQARRLDGIRASLANKYGVFNIFTTVVKNVFSFVTPNIFKSILFGKSNYDRKKTIEQFSFHMKLVFGFETPDDVIYEDDNGYQELLDKLKCYKNVTVDVDQFMKYWLKHYGKGLDTDPVLKPKLGLALRGRIKITPAVLVESLIKRNLDVSQLRDDFTTLDYEAVVLKFKEMYLKNDKNIELSEIFNPFSTICEWLDTRSSRQIGKLEATFDDDVIQKKRWNRYECFLKTTVKLKMTERESMSIIPVQVVTGANSMTVMYFNIYVKQMQQKLVNRLKDKFIYNDGFDVKLLEDKMNEKLSAEVTGFKRYKVVEMDYSKFDKNQDEMMMMYQLCIFEMLGIENSVITDYIISHLDCELIFREAGIRVQVNAQRRTGDAFTFFGNTLMTMMMAVYAFNDDDIVLGVFGGDDSIIFLKPKAVVRDESMFIASAFNMELKYLATNTSVMFASRFIFYDSYRIQIFPDVMKIITRVFREDIDTRDYLTAVTLSMKVLLHPIDITQIYDLIDVTANRYNLEHDTVSEIYHSFLELLKHGDIEELFEIRKPAMYNREIGNLELTVIKENVFKRISKRSMYDLSHEVVLTEREKKMLVRLKEIDNRMKPVNELNAEGYAFLYHGIHIYNEVGFGVPINQLEGGTLVDVEVFKENQDLLTNYIHSLKKNEELD